MRILFLSRWFPYPADNGAKLRVLNVLKQLGSRHEVVFIALGEPDSGNYVARQALAQWCTSIDVLRHQPFRPLAARALAGLLSPQPRFLVDTYQPTLSARIAARLQERPVDLVLASELDMLPYALEVRGVPRVLEDLEVTSYLDAVTRAHTPQQRLRAGLTWLKLTLFLRRVLPRFAACSVVSTREADNVHRLAPSYEHLVVLPNAVDLSTYSGGFGKAEANTLVFSGALTYAPNLDAARFFLGEVFPAIVARIPEVLVRLTGRTSGSTNSFLPTHPSIRLMGYVPDIRPVVARSAAAVAPVRAGSGTRVKILEAWALGTPVVATTKAAEGLDVRHGQEILLADTAPAFADRAVELLGSPSLRTSLAERGRRLVAQRYDWNVIGRDLNAVVESARVAGRPSQPDAAA